MSGRMPFSVPTQRHLLYQRPVIFKTFRVLASKQNANSTLAVDKALRTLQLPYQAMGHYVDASFAGGAYW